MRRIKVLRTWVKIKRKRYLILSSACLLAIFTVFQNCGLKSSPPSTSVTGGTTTAGTSIANIAKSETLSANFQIFNFLGTSGNPSAVWVVSNNSSTTFTGLTTITSIDSSVFRVSGDSCNQVTSLAPGGNCTLRVDYSNSTKSASSQGLVSVYYQNATEVGLQIRLEFSGPGTGASTDSGNTSGNARNSSYATIPIYREVSPSAGAVHISTTSLLDSSWFVELSGAPYFLLFKTQYDPSLIPIYECDLGGNRFMTTTEANCESTGTPIRELLGWAHSKQQSGEVRLYRFRRDEVKRRSPLDHLDTFNLMEGSGAGYLLDKTIAYVLPAGANFTPVSPPSPLTKPLYRTYNEDVDQHFVTSVNGEGSPDFITEETLGQIYAVNSDSDMVPLFRCYNHLKDNKRKNYHFSTLDIKCEPPSGSENDGITGWVHQTLHPGEIPLHRFFRTNSDSDEPGDHLDTSDPDEGTRNNYIYEKTLGYIMP